MLIYDLNKNLRNIWREAEWWIKKYSVASFNRVAVVNRLFLRYSSTFKNIAVADMVSRLFREATELTCVILSEKASFSCLRLPLLTALVHFHDNIFV